MVLLIKMYFEIFKLFFQSLFKEYKLGLSLAILNLSYKLELKLELKLVRWVVRYKEIVIKVNVLVQVEVEVYYFFGLMGLGRC